MSSMAGLRDRGEPGAGASADVPEAAEPKGVLGTIRNATVLLELLSQSAGFQSVTSLAQQSGLSVATAHRVLRSLAQAGLTRQSSRTLGYALGPNLVRLAECYLTQFGVSRALSPYLVGLRDLTKATIEVCVLAQSTVICVDRIDGESGPGVFRQSSRVLPTLESAAGRVLAAHGDEAAWSALPKRPSAKGEAERRREWGGDSVVYVPEPALEIQVAVPVRDHKGNVVAALSATTPLLHQDDQDQLAERLSHHLLRATELVQDSISSE